MDDHDSGSVGNTGRSRPLDEEGGGGGGGHPDPDIRGQSPKKNFSALLASVWSKDRGGQAPWAPFLDLPLGDGNNVLAHKSFQLAPKPFLISSIDDNPSVI